MPEVLTLQIPTEREAIALCGGPYSNFAAVEAFLAETADIPDRFCLGDMGGFGPFPNRTLDLVRAASLVCLQGNYDDSVGNGLRDCGCGYSDERDQHFAQVSYDYTYANTSEAHRAWLRSLPQHIVLEWRKQRILLCHGSPDQVNEFVWESNSDDAKIADYLQRYDVNGICVTHSGVPWIRKVDGIGFWFNVGVLGRPANTGSPQVTYGLLECSAATEAATEATTKAATETAIVRPRLMTLDYDVQATATAMRAEGLPEEFVVSLETGVWTTCAEILPEAERQQMAQALVSP